MIVVADTSPLTNLAVIGRLHILPRLYQRVLIPEAVVAELRAGEIRGVHPGFLDTSDWIDIRAATDRSLVEEFCQELDLGEAEAIALSFELQAELLLIDERKGRAVARQRGIRTVGLLGTLVASKSRGIIEAVRPIIDELRTDAGFWISDSLYARVLERVGEDE